MIIELPDDLFALIRQRAAETNCTLTAVIEDALRRALTVAATPMCAPPTRLTTFGSRGLQPGVDLDNGAALLERLEPPDSNADR